MLIHDGKKRHQPTIQAMRRFRRVDSKFCSTELSRSIVDRCNKRIPRLATALEKVEINQTGYASRGDWNKFFPGANSFLQHAIFFRVSPIKIYRVSRRCVTSQRNRRVATLVLTSELGTGSRIIGLLKSGYRPIDLRGFSPLFRIKSTCSTRARAREVYRFIAAESMECSPFAAATSGIARVRAQ